MPKTPLAAALAEMALQTRAHLGCGRHSSDYRRDLEVRMRLGQIRFRSEYAFPPAYQFVASWAQWRADFLVENRLLVEIVARDASVSPYLRLIQWSHAEPIGLVVDFSQSDAHSLVRPFILGSYQPRARPHWPMTALPSITS